MLLLRQIKKGLCESPNQDIRTEAMNHLLDRRIQVQSLLLSLVVTSDSASVQTQKHPKESQFDRETLMSVLRTGRVKHLVVQISSRFGYLLIYWKSPGLSCKRKHISAWERTLNQHRSALHRSILSCLTQLLSLFLSPSYPPTSAALFASTVIPPGDSSRII